MHIISKTFYFEASHKLPEYKGDCSRLHGHSYKLEIKISGDIDYSTGMIIDFKKLKGIVVDNILNAHDHSYLNDLYKNPTAELMGQSMAISLSKLFFEMNIILVGLKLWETRDSYYEWKAENTN